MARASILTYKGMMTKNPKSFEELLRENVYLTSILKQKEGQMEAAERQWKEKLVEAVRKATEDENDSSSENVSMNPLPSATVPSIPSTIPTNLPPVSVNLPPSTNPQNVCSFHFSNL